MSEAVPTADEALAGARDIIAESVAEDADIRATVRERTRAEAWLAVTEGDTAKDERGVYKMYYQFNEKLSQVAPHRVLAINRGEREGVLKVKLELPEDEVIKTVTGRVPDQSKNRFRRPDSDGCGRWLPSSLGTIHRAGTARRNHRCLGQSRHPDVFAQPAPVVAPTAPARPGCLGHRTPVSAPAARWRWWTPPASSWKERPSIRTSPRNSGPKQRPPWSSTCWKWVPQSWPSETERPAGKPRRWPQKLSQKPSSSRPEGMTWPT